MTTPTTKDDEIVFDSSRYLKLEIDKDGAWIQNGVPMTHPGIRSQFFKALHKTDDGKYFVKIGREMCSVIVSDAPFVVTTLDHHADGSAWIKLSDNTTEELKPDSVWIGSENIPYSRVKDGHFHARFSRAAYYQLARHIVMDEKDGKFYLDIGGKKQELPVRP